MKLCARRGLRQRGQSVSAVSPSHLHLKQNLYSVDGMAVKDKPERRSKTRVLMYKVTPSGVKMLKNITRKRVTLNWRRAAVRLSVASVSADASLVRTGSDSDRVF
jgi:hypothetical protein